METFGMILGTAVISISVIVPLSIIIYTGIKLLKK